MRLYWSKYIDVIPQDGFVICQNAFFLSQPLSFTFTRMVMALGVDGGGLSSKSPHPRIPILHKVWGKRREWERLRYLGVRRQMPSRGVGVMMPDSVARTDARRRIIIHHSSIVMRRDSHLFPVPTAYVALFVFRLFSLSTELLTRKHGPHIFTN